MAYNEKDIERIFDIICKRIEDGEALSVILRDNDMPDRGTVYKWIREDLEIFDKYTRATKIRADYLADEIIEIADKQGKDVKIVDGEEVTDYNVINRNRLQIDARKWAASKMNPKKYGDKVDVTTDGQPIKQEPTTVTFINARKNKE